MKPEREFFDVQGIAATASGHPGVSVQLLAEDPESGLSTSIERYAPGTDTSDQGVQRHDFVEEVYLLSGSFVDLTLGETFAAGAYACRPPGMPHGPWRSEEGVAMFVVRYR